MWIVAAVAAALVIAFAPLEPDSLTLVVVLLVVGAVLMVALVAVRQVAVRVVCGVVILAVAMAAGIVEVNRFYGYYASWSAMYNDLSGTVPTITRILPRHQAGTVRRRQAPPGQIRSVTIHGARSGITRPGLVYLPPQYGESRYAHTRFPVVELLHGSPGDPGNWVYQLHIQQVLDQLIDRRVMGPVVAVMPSIDDGHHYQDCVNGPTAADDTYIAADVPAYLRAHYRVSADPSELGVAGYSSGGYCAANLALRHRGWFGAAAVMDGYFRATAGPAAAALGDDPAAERANSPLLAARALRPDTTPMPAFWVGVGSGDRGDYTAAKAFVAALRHVERVDLVVDPGASHNYYAWAAQVPHALPWLWQQIASPNLRTRFPLAGKPRAVYVKPHPLKSNPPNLVEH